MYHMMHDVVDIRSRVVHFHSWCFAFGPPLTLSKGLGLDLEPGHPRRSYTRTLDGGSGLRISRSLPCSYTHYFGYLNFRKRNMPLLEQVSAERVVDSWNSWKMILIRMTVIAEKSV